MFENALPKYASENSHTCSEIKEKIYQKHIIKDICSKLTNKNTKAIGETYSKLAVEKSERYHLVSIS